MTTRRPQTPLSLAIRLRSSAGSLALLAEDMGQITAEPWPQHTAELQGAVDLLREWATAITAEPSA